MIHYSSNLVVNIFGAPFGARQNFFGARLGRKLAFLWGAKGNVRGATPPAPMYAPKKKTLEMWSCGGRFKLFRNTVDIIENFTENP